MPKPSRVLFLLFSSSICHRPFLSSVNLTRFGGRPKWSKFLGRNLSKSAAISLSFRDSIKRGQVHIDPKLGGGANQRLKGVPRSDALSGACLQAHISFADALSGTQFGWIVVQENLWMGKHHQQRFFLGPRQGEALIQLAVAARLSEEGVKGHPQRMRLGRTRMVSV